MGSRSVEEQHSMDLTLLGLAGCIGALLMFAADLVLYMPSKPQDRTNAMYFQRIDPGGDQLHVSCMSSVSGERLMLGGALGPLAASLYGVGFTQLFFGLNPEEGVILPCISAVCLATYMIVGAVYHAIFAYTGFIAAAIATRADDRVLLDLLLKHQNYLKYMYKWAAIPCAVGSAAFIWCCFARMTIYPWPCAFFAPAMSAPLKKCMKQGGFGGLVLAGGLTNLWNLIFFVIVTACALSARR